MSYRSPAQLLVLFSMFTTITVCTIQNSLLLAATKISFSCWQIVKEKKSTCGGGEEGLRKTFSCYIKNLKATPNRKTYATRDKKTARTTCKSRSTCIKINILNYSCKYIPAVKLWLNFSNIVKGVISVLLVGLFLRCVTVIDVFRNVKKMVNNDSFISYFFRKNTNVYLF